MAKKITTITILITSIILVSLLVISSTYSLIIDVTNKNGTTEMVNNITIKDLVTDNNGNYNSAYYDSLRELNITDKEADILMESLPLNQTLNTILNSIIDYKFHNKEKLTNNEIYDMIISAINNDDLIYDDLKNRVIINSRKYIGDLSDYLYDIDFSLIGA